MSVWSFIKIGRWSEPRLVLTSHVAYGRMDWLTMETSGEDWGPLLDSLVGLSSLRVPKSELPISSAMFLPLSSLKDECQRAWWAFRSPRISVSVDLSKGAIEAVLLALQLLLGRGM